MPTVFENEIFPSVWEHALRTAASASDDAAEAAALERGAATFADWRSGLSPSYEAVTETSTVIADLLRLSSLTEAELMLDLQAVRGGWRCRLHHRGGQIELSTIVPILQDLGAVVTEHRPFALLSRTVGGCWIHDLGLRLDGVASPHPSDPDRTSRFEEAFIAAFSGRAESDRLASLVMRAGLSWREVTVLRAYRRYQRQIGTAFTDRHVHEVLERHPIAVAGLIEFFYVRLAPDGDLDADLCVEVEERLVTYLDLVSSLDEDRILRSFLALVMATVRTNFHAGKNVGSETAVALKLDPSTKFEQHFQTSSRDWTRPIARVRSAAWPPSTLTLSWLRRSPGWA